MMLINVEKSRKRKQAAIEKICKYVEWTERKKKERRKQNRNK